MGFLDNVKDALRDAISTQSSKNAEATKTAEATQDVEPTKDAEAAKDEVVDSDDGTTADDSSAPAPPAIPAEPIVEPTETVEAKFETYTVKSGDALSEIGARFGVSSQEIAELNNIENPDLIFPGQVFRIPTS